jgi:hypothetical protein
VNQITPKPTHEEPIPGNQPFSSSRGAAHPRMKGQSKADLENAATWRKHKKHQPHIAHHIDTTVSTYNVLSLNQTGKLHQLVGGCIKS